MINHMASHCLINRSPSSRWIYNHLIIYVSVPYSKSEGGEPVYIDASPLTGNSGSMDSSAVQHRVMRQVRQRACSEVMVELPPALFRGVHPS